MNVLVGGRRLRTGVMLVVLCAACDKAAETPRYRLGERLPAAASSPAAGPVEEISWFALVPRGWDPENMVADGMAALSDSDPRAVEALQHLREAWDNAPVEPAMHGKRIRIPGFVVPLEGEEGQLTEFLLVPYFGACIHTPPPPANQVIHVIAAKPLNGVKTMDAVYISGTLETVHARMEQQSGALVGAAGYRMRVQAVTPYTGP